MPTHLHRYLKATAFLISIFLAFVILLPASGCGGGSNTTTNGGSSGGGNGGGGGGNGGGGGGNGGGGGTGGGGNGGGSSQPAFGHVFLIVEENHGFSSVIGNPDMPYFNSLASQNGLATQYFANTHPSIGNYFMLTTGQIETNDDSFTGVISDDNLVRELIKASISWKSYAESLPQTGYTGGNTGSYLQRHNPFSFFSDVVNDPAQAANLVPFSQFAGDLAAGNLPAFTYIVPNVQDDAHNGTLAQADQWLQQNIQPLLDSALFQKDGLLIITWDEAEDSDTAHGGGRIATLIISPKAKAGFQSQTFYQHQSALRLILSSLGVTNFPGASASAPDMSEFLQ
jgi:phosphatidylinositol-3-phosphatase